MAVKWIEDKRTELVQIYRDSLNKKEPVLKAFCIYILRILDGLAQMEYSRLYGYEDQVFGGAMKLFCEHYAEQVRSILFSDAEFSLEEKKSIAEDIENSISRISNVYKNVIDSISNLDLQMITSQAVETSVYDISPKLFTTYSIILETLVRLFDKQGIYAFLLHPSVKSYVETISLFNRREKEGKVVLIYLPENEIDKIRQIPLYLLHEAFHVLTREERNRKKRAGNMELHMLIAVSQSLFRNVYFDFVSSEEAENIKVKLTKRWFRLEERLQYLNNMNDSSRQLYSKNIKEEICENWRMWLSEILITLRDDLCQVLTEIEYNQGEDPYEQLPIIEWNLQNNIVEILTNNRIKEYAHLYMTVYREAYADAASILMTGISPDIYEQAFIESNIINRDNDAKYQDIIRALRVHTVSRAVVACGNINHIDDWKKYSEENDYTANNSDKEGMAKSTEKEIGTITKRVWEDNYIQIAKDDLVLFEDIIEEGSKKLWKKIGEREGLFERFRKIMEDMNLLDILNEKVNEDLRSLAAQK